MHALVPVKRFLEAKTRLAGHLTPATRANLAQQMAEHVLSQLSRVAGLQVAVVSGEPQMRPLCRHFGCELLPEENVDAGLNAIVHSALRRLHGAGARRALILHADLPRLRSADVMSLVTRHSHSDVVLVPDRHEQGTNALLCSLPLVFDLQFGPGSFRLHDEAARARGLRVEVERFESLAWDVDVIDDLPGSPVLCQASRPPMVAERKYFCR
jgi:2-phospho-L-lactate guanylyltransferase